MIITTLPAVPKPAGLFLFDKVVGQLQDILKNNLPWLDYSFGLSQKLATKVNGRILYYPGIHTTYTNYVSMFPDTKFGNYSFFKIEDPQSVDFKSHSNNRISAKYSVIFWLNLDKIFADTIDRNKEEIKAEILKILTKKVFLKFGRITVENIYELANNIYDGYNIDEIDSQYLMQPYAGFRFSGTLTIEEPC